MRTRRDIKYTEVFQTVNSSLKLFRLPHVSLAKVNLFLWFEFGLWANVESQCVKMSKCISCVHGNKLLLEKVTFVYNIDVHAYPHSQKCSYLFTVFLHFTANCEHFS